MPGLTPGLQFQLPTVLDTDRMAGRYIPVLNRVTRTVVTVRDGSANACTRIPTDQNGSGRMREQRHSLPCEMTCVILQKKKSHRVFACATQPGAVNSPRLQQTVVWWIGRPISPHQKGPEVLVALHGLFLFTTYPSRAPF